AFFCSERTRAHIHSHSFPTRRSSDLEAVAHPGIQMQLGVDPQIAERIEPAHIDADAFECRAISQFREFERKTDRTDLRMIRIRQDRKSTRLNSSHSQISYAVFCLKKK